MKHWNDTRTLVSTLQGSSAESPSLRVDRLPPEGWNSYLTKRGYDGFHLRSEWAAVFRHAFRHATFFVWEEQEGRIRGVLPLTLVSGPLFGRFLVSQPYLNTGGVIADSEDTAARLMDRAIHLADELDVRYLELRHEQRISHAQLNAVNTSKVHMRLELPADPGRLWDGLKSKLRSQIRKPLNDPGLSVTFGHKSLLEGFYDVFCQNMRDLGTPPFSKKLFREMLEQFGDASEICSVSLNRRVIAAGFLLHGPEVTLIPSASSLRAFNHCGCNMLLYWHCLKRSVERGQKAFDFGRSTRDSGTFRFKQQWGAEPYPAVWQYYVREGQISEMRPDGGKYDRIISIWKKLPVWLTRLAGPEIVRGIP